LKSRKALREEIPPIVPLLSNPFLEISPTFILDTFAIPYAMSKYRGQQLNPSLRYYQAL
jgi:hypothetical protein